MSAHAVFQISSILNNNTTLSHRTPINNASRPSILQNLWLKTLHKSLSLSLSNLQTPQFPKHRPITATIVLSLPTANQERSLGKEKMPKWSKNGLRAFGFAEIETRKLRYPTTGTESLILGILVEGTSLIAKFLRANGITHFKVREETLKLLGKGDPFFMSPEHPPLTEDAQRALDWAVDQELSLGTNGEITTSHLLLGIWSQIDSPGQKILVSLGFDDEMAKNLLSLISESGFVED